MNTYRIGNHYAKPRHLRNVLAMLCKVHGPYLDPSSHVDTQIADWINDNFTSDQITTAHYNVVDQYRSGAVSRRGRPLGALNRNKRDYSQGATPIDTEIANMLATPAEETPAKPNGAASAHIDLSNYVTRPEFGATNAALANLAVEMAKTFVDADKRLQSLEQSKPATDIENRLTALEQAKPTIVHIKHHNSVQPTSVGLVHHKFPKLLTACNARYQNGRHLNIYVYGPAGTGKSFAAQQCHDAIFGDRYPFRMSGMALMAYEFLGHMHGNQYVSTQFRQAFEHGGVFCADEFDRYAAGATVALNNALANGVMAFPDGMIKRHPDFIFIACANTQGTGATHEYNTANKQDAATMNRFGARIHWPIDDALEDAMAYNKDWLSIVRKCRANIQHHGIKGVMITPRQTQDGQALIDEGLNVKDVEELVLRQGLDDVQWSKVRGI